MHAGTGPCYLSRDAGGLVRGVLYDGPNLVFAVRSAEDVDAFAAAPLGGRGTRMIVGPRLAVERFWAKARGRFNRPSAYRDSQPVYALEPGRVSTARPRTDLDIRPATLDELDELALQAAVMAAGEFSAPPPARVDFGFRSRTAQTITAGGFWRARRAGKLVFQCYVGATSPFTAQIQGVWSPPGARGQGDASAAFTAICATLLQTYPSLSLYVNGFNERAIALYERTGFRRVSEFASVIF